jgi:site-specific DNA recombinase
MRCIIYIRVSTDDQAKHGYSIAAQEEKLKAFCISQGWEIVGEPFIDDGYSAKDLNRPKFQLMLNEIKKGKADVLLVYKLDRLTRSVLDLYKVLQILDEYNCKFRSATEVYDTTNAMGRLFITLVAAIAQWERENTAERVRMGMEKKTKLGKWKGGMAPYGYLIKNTELTINPDEEPLIKYIFKLSKTHGFYTIAKQLTQKGFATRKGGNWHVDTVRDIANNPIYAGYLSFNDPKIAKKPPREQQLYEGVHPRIISREDFWELQDILDKRRTFGGKRETSNYYFSSILKCARCGSSMSGHKGTKGVKTYRCSGKKAGKKCTSHIIKEDSLVIKVLADLHKITSNIHNNNEQENISTKRIEELENELKLIQKLLKKQKTMYEKDVIDIDELISKTESLRVQEKNITNELNQYMNAQKVNSEEIQFIIENIHDLWNHINDFDRKQMITTIFTQIVIDTKDEYKRGTGKPREIIIVSAK